MSTENKASPFKVSIRLISGNNSLLAKADVIGKTMNINGFSVMANKKDGAPWVAEPSMKSGSGYVKIVEITDKATKEAITKSVLDAYKKAVEERTDSNDNDEPAF
ncbi:MAG: septation protein SpoVG family protein [Candidatus Riflebacteria bacterium]|nr:septation protein SpoVG family protein [Candidatus Riflebacteria bacterium]